QKYRMIELYHANRIELSFRISAFAGHRTSKSTSSKHKNFPPLTLNTPATEHRSKDRFMILEKPALSKNNLNDIVKSTPTSEMLLSTCHPSPCMGLNIVNWSGEVPFLDSLRLHKSHSMVALAAGTWTT
ncbi:Hypothetical predicted protein, partial [Paramuricea clavata]